MNSKVHRQAVWGFTLIELLVVIAIIAILAAVLTPAVTGALASGRMTGTMTNGRSIYQAIMAKQLGDPIYGSDAAYPTSTGPGNFTDSTAFFRWLCSSTGGQFAVDPSFFAAQGVPAAPGTNFASPNFTSNNNAWCISADISEASPDPAPLLFTKNLRLTPDQLNGDASLNEQQNPFRGRGCVVVTKGGSAVILKPQTLTNVFLGRNMSVSNKVLRP